MVSDTNGINRNGVAYKPASNYLLLYVWKYEGLYMEDMALHPTKYNKRASILPGKLVSMNRISYKVTPQRKEKNIPVTCLFSTIVEVPTHNY